MLQKYTRPIYRRVGMLHSCLEVLRIGADSSAINHMAVMVSRLARLTTVATAGNRICGNTSYAPGSMRCLFRVSILLSCCLFLKFGIVLCLRRYNCLFHLFGSLLPSFFLSWLVSPPTYCLFFPSVCLLISLFPRSV